MAKIFKYGSLAGHGTGRSLGAQHQGKQRQRAGCAADTIKARVDSRMARGAAALEQLLKVVK